MKNLRLMQWTRGLVLVMALPLAAAAQNSVQFLQPYGPTTRPFSPATRVGNTLYLAGQVGTAADAKGSAIVPGGIAAETKQVMLNIKDVLEKSGSDMEHVAKCTVFMADMKEWDAMNEVYRTFFKDGKFPARSAFGTSGLALNARVEIECIAVVK
ncbi:MAG: RidA family protein [Gemmatimonadetes bacterium]|nr:RidA family protein [Gemmatimonadota bacterium]